MKKVITLVEVVIALVILSVIAALAIPRQSSYIENTYESALDAIERNMFNNVERIERAYKKGEGLKLTFKNLQSTSNGGNPNYYGLGVTANTTSETNLTDGNHLIPQATVTIAPVPGNADYYFTTVTLEFDAYKGNDANNLIAKLDPIHTAALPNQDIKGYACNAAIYHALTGLDYQEYNDSAFEDVSRIFAPHGIEYDASHNTGPGELTCRWKTPKELGKSQRHYEYNVVTNELKRLS